MVTVGRLRSANRERVPGEEDFLEDGSQVGGRRLDVVVGVGANPTKRTVGNRAGEALGPRQERLAS